MIADGPVENQSQPQSDGGLGALHTDVLTGTTHVASDLNMVRRAVRERWGIPAEKRPRVVDRLLQIIDVEETTVVGTDGGEYKSFDAADKNAIQAARVLVAMEGQNQGDDHHADKQGNDDARLENETLSVAVAAYSRLSDAEKVALAVKSGKVDKLPPRLREMATKGA